MDLLPVTSPFDSCSRFAPSLIDAMQTVRAKQDLMVEENVLKLEVRRLRSILNARADNVQS